MNIEEIWIEIKQLFQNYDKYYKPYNKETMFKALQIDIEDILKKYLPKTKETTFILEGEEHDAFSLIYKLADKGIIHELDHDNMEEEGVKVIL